MVSVPVNVTSELSALTRLKITWSKRIEDKLDKELVKLGISRELLQSIVTEPDEVLLDSENGRKVAVNLSRTLP